MSLRHDLERRLAEAEPSAAETSHGPIVPIDVTKLSDADRGAYWAGDHSVATAMDTTPAKTPGQITASVISLHPESQKRSAAAPYLNEADPLRPEEADGAGGVVGVVALPDR